MTHDNKQKPVMASSESVKKNNPRIIDRRKNTKKKSLQNRQRFLRRVDASVKRAVKDRIKNGSISDIINNEKTDVSVPVKDIKEPSIHHDQGGLSERVYPGNKQFNQGDRIPRPPGGGGSGGSGSGASDSDEIGEDEFIFQLSKEEFLGYFFDELELPDLLKKEITITEDFSIRRNGYSSEGSPSQLDVLRTMKEAFGRRFGLTKTEDKLIKKNLKEQERELLISIDETTDEDYKNTLIQQLFELRKELKSLRKKNARVAFVDDMDMRYRQWTTDPIPASQAVVFCVMDVSGSMGEWEKELSKKFYMLLYLFLNRQYKHIELVFIRHHTTAKECDEDEFFHSRETGGTIVSCALQKTLDIIHSRYDLNHWNIYMAQTSDGDNWPSDIPQTTKLIQKLLQIVQYYFYIETSDRESSELSDSFNQLNATNFKMQQVNENADIFKAFKEIFKKKDA